MDLNCLNFLIYSSHKTSTQTIKKILVNNKYKTEHYHNITDSKDKCMFIKSLKEYKKINKNKIKIISCIRNPKERLISSFFQSYGTDEIKIKKIKQKNTTISIMNLDNLIKYYERLVKNNKLPGRLESLDTLSNIIGINVIDKLQKKKKYYYYEHDLFRLYVLDFNLITNNNNLLYLNNTLNLNLTISGKSNLSEKKFYYQKYKYLKKNIGTKLDSIIENQYNKFYFNSF